MALISDKPMSKARWYGRVSTLTLAVCIAAGTAPAFSNPLGGTVVGGQASISESGNTLTVTQGSDRAIINWDSFSIGAGETTRFIQPSATSITANRVTGVDPSRILGSLEANGQVVLTNRNGIVFGQGARVDAAGLIATVHDFEDVTFMSGRSVLRFDDGGNSNASVVNEGTITIKEAGLAALVAPHVRNSGVIEANLGRVALASAKGFSVDLYGDGLLSFAPGDALDETLGDGAQALVENSGTIHAAGGKILLTARAAEAVVNASVNISGVVQASSVSSSGGVIRLGGPGEVRIEKKAKVVASGKKGGGRIAIKAGKFTVDGTVKAEGVDADGRAVASGGFIGIAADSIGLGGLVSASGKSGGRVEVSASGLLSLAGTTEAVGLMGSGGDVAYEAGRIIETTTATTYVSGLVNGGTITAKAEHEFATSGSHAASGIYGSGGRIDLTAPDLRLFSTTLAASGRKQGGLVRAGGPFQGGKTPDESQPYHHSFVRRWGDLPALDTATQTFVNDGTTIDVSAWQGIGGTAVIWSDERTTFLGGIDARGTYGGGSVEISSAGDLRRADLTGVSIGGGYLLLDPKNIIIGDAATVQSWAYQGIIGFDYGATGTKTSNIALEAGDVFGISVSLNDTGDRLAVGAHQDDGADNGTAGSGAVYLFSFTDTNFSGGTLEGVIGKGYTGGKNFDVNSLEANDHFGVSVALNASGDRLAVGAHGDDGAGATTTNYGAVYLFSFADTDFSGGVLEATIGQGYTGSKDVNVALDASDFFGFSVSLNGAGDRLAVGTHADDGAGAGSTTDNYGAVHLFSFTDTSFTGGTRQAIIGQGYTGGKNVGVSLDAGDQFGVAVALNDVGDRLAVGAYLDDGAGAGSTADNYGAVYLFSFTDTSFTGGGRQATIGQGYTGGKNVNLALEAGDQFGVAISLNAAGDRLAAGAHADDGAGVGSTSDNYGAVYLFSFADTSFTGGARQATIGRGYSGGKNLSVPLDAADLFGRAVSLNGTGDRLVSAVTYDDGAGVGSTGDNRGAIYLFTFSDADFSSGALVGTIGSGYVNDKNVNVKLDASDVFGVGVSLNGAGDRMAVGAHGDDGIDNATAIAGAVYLFSFTDTNFSGAVLEGIIGKGYTGGKNVDLSTLEAGDTFGRSVSLNAAGNRLAVGARGDDGVSNGTVDAGAVYLFTFTDTNFSGGSHVATIGKGYAGSNDVNIGTLDASDLFGEAVSLSSDGRRLAVGAQYDDGAGVGSTSDNYGAVYLFSFTDTSFSGGTLEATMGQGYTGGKNVNVALDPTDRFGVTVALNGTGNRLAVGALWDDGPGNSLSNSGAAYLFSFTDTNFSGGTRQATIGQGYTGGKNISVALEANDTFGLAVSLNAAGDRLAVSAWNDYGATNAVAGSGAVYLFSFADTNFSGGTQEAIIGVGYTGGKNINVALDANDRFGIGVSLNGVGDRLAVGAHADDGSANSATDSGAVYLFSFTDTNFSGGRQLGTMGANYVGGKDINVTSLSASDLFGASVSLNGAGDRLAVGAHLDDGAGAGSTADNIGAVYLFSFTDTNFSGGVLEGIIGKGYTGGKNVDVTTLEVGDNFGISVSLNGAGDRLAVGAYLDDGDGAGSTADNYGAVYLFSFTDTSFSGGAVELMIGKGYMLDLASLDASDGFGVSVSLNAAGDRLAVGANGDDGANELATDAGAAYLFSFADNSFSTVTGVATIGSGYTGSKDINLALDNGDRFGRAVSLNGAGDRLAVGAPHDGGSTNATASAGAVYLFSYADTSFTGGTHEATIGSGYTGTKDVSVVLDATDVFGRALSLNERGDILAVGADGDDGAANGTSVAGAVHIFGFTDTSFSGGQLQNTIGQGYTGTYNADLALDANDHFGISVSLNAAGDRLAVAAHADDGSGNALTNAGAVYLFSAVTHTGPYSPPLSYSDFSGQTITVSAAEIAAVLAQGTSVTLQASNDITVSKAIAVTNPTAAAGGLTLQAGRSLLINANIASAGGDVTLIANDLLANGVIDAERDPGAAVITMASGTSIDAGGGAVLFELRDGTGKTNLGSGDITLGSITAGTISAVNAGPTAGSGIVLDTGAVLTANGMGDAIVLAGQDFTNNAGSTALDAANGRWLVWSVDPANDTRGGLVYDFKQYNATYGVTTPAQATGNGFLYEIAPMLTVGLTGTVTKVYDATTAASLAAGNYTILGAIDGDTATSNTPTSGIYNDKNVGTGKNVTVNGISVTATDGTATVYGYQYNTTTSGAVGEITQAQVSVGLTGTVTKVYDATTAATLAAGHYAVTGLIAGDAVALNNPAAGSYGDKNAGSGKTVTVSGLALSGADAANYALVATTTSGAVGEITQAQVSVGLTGTVAKVYDATTAATLAAGHYAVTGLIAGDAVALNNPAAGSYGDKNAGSGKTVTVSGLALNGTDAGNYALVATTTSGAVGEITQAQVSVGLTGTVTKVYDATTAATLAAGHYAVSGLIAGDAVALNNPTAGSYGDKNAGSGKTVTVSGLALSGADAANYALVATTASGAVGEITQAQVSVGLTGTVAKVYDATTAATLAAGHYAVSGLIAGDAVALNNPAAGSYGDKNAGSGKTVTVSGLALSGTDAANYALVATTTSGAVGEITQAQVSVGLTGTVTKVYDATTAATLAAGHYAVTGLIAGDDVALNNPTTGTFANNNVGTGKIVTVSGLALNGTDAANYVLVATTASGAVGEIRPATVMPSPPPVQKVKEVVQPALENIESASELFGCASLGNAAPQLVNSQQPGSVSCMSGAPNHAVTGFPSDITEALMQSLNTDVWQSDLSRLQ